MIRGYEAPSTMFYSALSPQHSVLSPQHSVLKWVDKTNAKLAAIDSAAWTEEEKTAFATSLGELKKTLLALLKTKPVTPA